MDNVYKVLMGDDAPFLGLANNKYNEFLRRGKIINVHYDISQNNVQNTYTFNTVDIAWIDGQPYNSTNIPISYSMISTNGWGIQTKPEIGDFVIAAFLPNSKPEILRFLKRSEFLQLGQTNINENKQILNQYGDPIKTDETSYIPFRNILPGEIDIKSKKESEVFLDDYGALKLITREQLKECCNDRLWELSIGEKIIDEGTKQIKKDNENNNIQFELLGYKNNFLKNISSDGSFFIQNNSWNITCNTKNELTLKNIKGDILTINDGTINFTNSKGDSIEISNGKIKIGSNANESMVLGDTLKDFMQSIIDSFNSHTHIGNLGDPTSTPLNKIAMKDFLSKKIIVE